MKCPKCKDIEMLKFSFQGVEVDRCQRCDGVLLDKGELGEILERELGVLVEQVSFTPSPMSNDQASAHCFRCDKEMIDLVGAAEVRFEWCDGCDAMFFDKGELSIIQAFEAD